MGQPAHVKKWESRQTGKKRDVPEAYWSKFFVVSCRDVVVQYSQTTCGKLGQRAAEIVMPHQPRKIVTRIISHSSVLHRRISSKRDAFSAGHEEKKKSSIPSHPFQFSLMFASLKWDCVAGRSAGWAHLLRLQNERSRNLWAPMDVLWC